MSRSLSLAFICAVIAAGLAGPMRTPIASGEPEKKISINAADIGRSVEIIGRLGKPMGTLMSVRGRWQPPSDHSKPLPMEFHVTHVDGKPLEKDVIYFGNAVAAENLKNQLDHQIKGVVWEMRAFEDGRFVNLIEKNWEEFYKAPPAPANYGQGPFTCFLTGNVKKAIRPSAKPADSKPR